MIFIIRLCSHIYVDLAEITMLEPCAGSHIERSRVRPIGRRRRSVQAPAHTTRHDRSSRARGNAPRSGTAGQSSRDSLAPIIPQRVSARTEAARRSGTQKAPARGGTGAGAPPPSGIARQYRGDAGRVPQRWQQCAAVMSGRAGTRKRHRENLRARLCA